MPPLPISRTISYRPPTTSPINRSIAIPTASPSPRATLPEPRPDPDTYPFTTSYGPALRSITDHGFVRPYLAIVVACGCGSSPEARLDRVEPSEVTSVVATPAIVYGEGLFAAANVALDGPTTIDHGWTV